MRTPPPCARGRSNDDGARYVPPPQRLFCQPDELMTALAGHDHAEVEVDGTGVPALSRSAAVAAVCDALPGGRVVVAAGEGAARLHALLSRRRVAARLATGWEDALEGPPDVAAVTGVGLRRRLRPARPASAGRSVCRGIPHPAIADRRGTAPVR